MQDHWDRGLFSAWFSVECLVGAAFGPCGIAIIQSEVAESVGLSPMKATLCSIFLCCYGMGYNRYKLRRILMIRGQCLCDMLVYCFPLGCFAVAQESAQVAFTKSAHEAPCPTHSFKLNGRQNHEQDASFDAASSVIEEGSRHGMLSFHMTKGKSLFELQSPRGSKARDGGGLSDFSSSGR